MNLRTFLTTFANGYRDAAPLTCGEKPLKNTL